MKDSGDKLSEFEQAEISQIYEALRNYDNSRWQLAALFATANISSVAIGLSIQKYGVVLLSTIILFLLFIGDLMLKSSLIVPLYRGLKLERQHSASKHSFFRIYLAVHSRRGNRHKIYSEMNKILELDQVDEIAERLRKLFLTPFEVRTGVTSLAVLGIVIELVLGISLALASWPAF
jgi:hypothetical protein